METKVNTDQETPIVDNQKEIILNNPVLDSPVIVNEINDVSRSKILSIEPSKIQINSQELQMTNLEKHLEVKRRMKSLYGREMPLRMFQKTRHFQSEQLDEIIKYQQSLNVRFPDENAPNENQKVKIEQTFLSRYSDFFVADNFIISMDSGWKQVFDTSILLVIAFSCLTSVYFVSFDQPINDGFAVINWIVTFIFALDFFFNFCKEYQDKETFQRVRSHYDISWSYFKSGWMLLDFFATFPFDAVLGDFVYTKLIRLLRLSKLIALLDINRIKRLIKKFFENSTRKDRLQAQQNAINYYKIFRLILIVMLLTYLLGCLWWFYVTNINTQADIDAKNTYITKYAIDEIWYDSSTADPYCSRSMCNAELFTITPLHYCFNYQWQKDNCKVNVATQVLYVCYFALTTLSTIGYGDQCPVSLREIYLGMVLMLVGIVFFSQIMNSFIEIITISSKNQSESEALGSDLNKWMNLLNRFNQNSHQKQAKNNEQFAKIDNFFSHFWAFNRLNHVTYDNEYLNQCPRSVRQYLVLNYMFDDIIQRFRYFFNTNEQNLDFLYDVCFGFRPIRFEAKTDIDADNELILDEESVVSEIYFIMEGKVGVGFSPYVNSKKKPTHQITINKNSYIFDYYVCFNKKCEFIYSVIASVSAFSISKEFLCGQIKTKYPQIFQSIKEKSNKRYDETLRKPLNKMRQEHLREENAKNHSKRIQINEEKTESVGKNQVDQNTYFSYNESNMFYQKPRQNFINRIFPGNQGATSNHSQEISFNSSKINKPIAFLNQKQGNLEVESINSGIPQVLIENLFKKDELKKTFKNDQGLRQSLLKMDSLKANRHNKAKVSTETNLNLILQNHMDQIGEEMLEWENILSDFSVALDSELSNFSENVENLQKRIKKIYFKGIHENQSATSSIEATKSTSQPKKPHL